MGLEVVYGGGCAMMRILYWGLMFVKGVVRGVGVGREEECGYAGLQGDQSPSKMRKRGNLSLVSQ